MDQFRLKRRRRATVRRQPGVERYEDRVLLATLTVLNTDDSGPGSLRQAIIDANADPDLSSIEFGFTDIAPTYEINLASALPDITAPIYIDGTLGTAGTPNILIDGQGLSGYGFNLSAVYDNVGTLIQSSDGSTIKNLAIVNFGQEGPDAFGAGIHIETTTNLIVGNYIGTDLTGKMIGAGNLVGILVENAGGNTIGGTGAGDGNLISGNLRDGISLSFTSGNTIIGNNIGATAGDINAPTLFQPLGNLGNGIFLFSSWDNIIGGDQAGAGNLIVANGMSGIDIDQFSFTNLVSGNAIGTTFFATSGIGVNPPPANLGNVLDGILLNSTSGNTIGGTTSVGLDGKIVARGGNIISGNGLYGIEVQRNDDLDFMPGDPNYGNFLFGNLIGTNATGTASLPNGADGILIADSEQNTIGGRNSLHPNGSIANLNGNLISGNRNAGLTLNGSLTMGNTVQGNRIGTNLAGTLAIANGTVGVRVSVGAASNVIGGTVPGAGNLISGNAQGGITLSDSGTTGNTIVGNVVGLNAAGTATLPNLGDGILIRAGGNIVGGSASGAGNVISGNTGAGVRLAIGANGTRILGNRIGTDVTGIASGVGNVRSGVEINDASSTTIGGLTATPGMGAGNVISGNRQTGVHITGASTATVIQGNIVGLDAAGTAHQGNSLIGIRLDGVVGNTVGGSLAGAGNVLSNNGTAGLAIENNSRSNLVQGNLIGTDLSGSLPMGPIQNGILIVASTGNTIGGTDGSSGNVISGNGLSGVLLSGGGTSGNVVLGNRIGTDGSGTRAVANGLDGVLIDSAVANTIGGTAPGSRNLISGNRSHGIEILGTSGTPQGNLVQGNRIGTDISGTGPLGNSVNGVFLGGGANGNLIGGADAAAGNLISGNQSNGVELFSTASANLVQGNRIGTDISGTLALGNNNSGVYSNNASGNSIGGPTGATGSGAGNLISGNNASGVLIAGAGSGSNLIQGNLIGLDVTALRALPNLSAGITIDGAGNNSIGGDQAGAGNIIAANRSFGVVILGTGATGNRIAGNLIGTNSAGTSGLGNALDGVILNASPSNTVGGPSAGARNVISGNGGNGIQILNIGGLDGIAILGNLIGTAPSGFTALGNGLDGILLNGVAGTVIAASALPNVISGNGGNGIHSIGSGGSAVIQGNLIGTDIAGSAGLGNGNDGIRLSDFGANLVGGSAGGQGNVISGNLNHGIQIDGANSVGNVLLGNTIGTNGQGTIPLGNGGYGISIEGTRDTLVQAGLISGNGTGGIQITGAGASGNNIFGNTIGTDRGGSNPLGNGLASQNNGVGIFVNGAGSNRIGGDGPGQGNLISGNATAGVYIFGRFASGNVVLGNRIGTDTTGRRPLLAGASPIQQVGVLINQAPGLDAQSVNLGPGNSIGGTTPGTGNLISGNGIGVQISGTDSQGNLVTGNLIGPSASGEGGAGNTVGVYINGAPGNTIGGPAGNVISGNSSVGVYILGSPSTGNQVTGNIIGLTPDGSQRLPNQTGVYIENAPRNMIGGTTPASRNIISANLVAGVYIVGSQSVGNVVKGNFIGYAVNGRTRLANGQYGVLLYNAPANNVVRRGRNANRIARGAIASFREFTGRPVAANGNKSRKASPKDRVARPMTAGHRLLVGHATPAGPLGRKG